MPPVCLVIGAGRGIGSAIAKRFAREGFTACVVRRSDGEGLAQLVAEIEKEGGKACAFQLDATDEQAVNNLVSKIESEVGPIEVLVYNLGANVGQRSIGKTSPRLFQTAWKLGSLGAFLAAHAVGPRMVKRGRGTMLFTGATAGVRGNQGQHAHSAGMFARRALSQTLAHELGPKGIHVAHVIVDGPVNAPDTLGKHFKEAFEALKRDRGSRDALMEPVDIAENYWHLHSQRRTAWTQELDLRPWSDAAWFQTTMMPVTSVKPPAKL